MKPNPSAHPDVTTPDMGWALAALALVAPTLIAAHDPPSVTFYNQAIAALGWGLWLAWVGRTSTASLCGRSGPGRQGLAAMSLVLVLQAAQALWAGANGPVPLGLGLMGGGLALGALLALHGGWHAGASGEALPTRFFAGLTAAGLIGLVLGLVQVFHPAWADGAFLAVPTMAGRAVGNLRQPNHFSTLLVFACAAAAWLGAHGRLHERLAALCVAGFIGGIVLTASRTGMLGMAFLTLWGCLDRRLPRTLRWTLIAAPAIYGVAWGGMWLWSHADRSVAFAAEARLHDGSDISSSRFKIWANVLELIRQQPWLGVGYGRFNFAWTMTPFPDRPVAFFDHTHNLPLQWAVEFGVPMALLMLGLCLLAMWRVLQPWRPAGATGQASAYHTVGASAVILAIAGLHSLLEYPLWYSYFLWPTAFALGLGLAARSQAREGDSPARPDPQTAGLRMAPGLIMAALAVWCAVDYTFAANIYAPRAGAGPLDQRIARGMQMPWWGYQADYARVNRPDEDEPSLPPEAFRRTVHNLMDARLMMAYARSLAEHGQEDKARYVVQRLHEFRNSMAKDWKAMCEAAPSSPESAEPMDEADEAVPFQCAAPQGHYTWRDLEP
ncbi:MAG: O-antigen ligase C-terminal domain-containing protein [Proteobacteria bacterium]|uniref:PglL family O-oligosaccharyltransferase n=1 Tax=Aquabacterium sp. TaxID=1872578 RepID=UPI0035C74EAF|nr:O-antigen ligase C-terminal domain-containing protein [Pseudomonadota bacterium]